MYVEDIPEHQELDHYSTVVEEIMEKSPYKEKAPCKKATMTVPEMRALLGLKKTDSYWLFHKNYFKTKKCAGQYRIDLESFEKWYANQSHYHKVTGEPPGQELKKTSYLAEDIAEILQISPNSVYEHMNKGGVEYICVGNRRRYLRDSFEKWYKNQNRLLSTEDREAEEVRLRESYSMPDLAKLLGIERSVIYAILDKYNDEFEFYVIGEQKRVTAESFYRWYSGQSDYKIKMENGQAAVEQEPNKEIEAYRRNKLKKSENIANIGTIEYLTIPEVAILAKVEQATVSKWIKAGKFSYLKMARTIRIPRKDFEEWLKEKQKKEKEG